MTASSADQMDAWAIGETQLELSKVQLVSSHLSSFDSPGLRSSSSCSVSDASKNLGWAADREERLDRRAAGLTTMRSGSSALRSQAGAESGSVRTTRPRPAPGFEGAAVPASRSSAARTPRRGRKLDGGDRRRASPKRPHRPEGRRGGKSSPIPNPDIPQVKATPTRRGMAAQRADAFRGKESAGHVTADADVGQTSETRDERTPAGMGHGHPVALCLASPSGPKPKPKIPTIIKP